MGNCTLLCEKLDECGFQRWDFHADGAVLQLYVEMNAPEMREPAQFLVGFECRELARICVLYSEYSSMRETIRLRGQRTLAVGRAFGSWRIEIVARSAER
jgi:hypothetical protein